MAEKLPDDRADTFESLNWEPIPPAPSDVISGTPLGSVFIGNTSYSGADIKLVVHIYNNYLDKSAEVDDARVLYVSTDEHLKAINTQIQLVNRAHDVAKEGTPEHTNLDSRLVKLVREYDACKKRLESASKKLSKAEAKHSSEPTQVLADIQTISISSSRIKDPVRALGSVYPRSYVRGQRIIAGSMVFTVFNEHVLYKLLQAHPSDFDGYTYSSALLDQMPPMDITIAFANEYGYVSRMGIYGVEFMNEGMTLSIEDILTENAVQYVARDFDPLRSVETERNMDGNSEAIINFAGKKASDLLLEDEYQKVKNMLNPMYRFNARNNPFV